MVFKWTQEMSAKMAFCESFLDTVYGANLKCMVAKFDTICFLYTMSTVYCILYTIHYTLYTIHYTLYTMFMVYYIIEILNS